MLGGVKIIESWEMYDEVEDWSRVRSPSRAVRRRRYGHRQNVRTIRVPKLEAMTIDNGRTLIMHPVMAAELRRQVKSVERSPWEVGFNRFML